MSAARQVPYGRRSVKAHAGGIGMRRRTHIGTAAKVESSDIYPCEFDTSGDSPSCAKSHNRASEQL